MTAQEEGVPVVRAYLERAFSEHAVHEFEDKMSRSHDFGVEDASGRRVALVKVPLSFFDDIRDQAPGRFANRLRDWLDDHDVAATLRSAGLQVQMTFLLHGPSYTA
ncbi:MAG: hypothetical protein U0807_15240 [Candidatus Binatia bacterium]